jgi:pseudouridine kinase
LDITSSPKSGTKLITHTSNPGTVELSYGGVARNVCEVLVDKLQVTDSLFISAIGNDQFGHLLKSHLGNSMKLDLEGIITGSSRTAVYNCIMDERGEMIGAIADMDILEKDITANQVEKILKSRMSGTGNRVIFLDGNLSVNVLKTVSELVKNSQNYSIFFDPTSVPKSIKPIDADCLAQMTYIKPNEDEIFAMAKHLQTKIGSKFNLNSLDSCIDLLILKGGVKHILLTCGPKGVIYATRQNSKIVKKKFDAFKLPKNARVNVTGCGDNFCGGFIYGITYGHSIEKSIQMGMKAAHLTLQSPFAVHPDLNVKSLE